MNWQAHIGADGEARLYRLTESGEPLTFRALFQLMEGMTRFADWYTQTLADSGLSAFFWEHPPLTAGTIDTTAEFALIPAPALAGIQPRPAPFGARFAQQSGRDVITFENLGGDALLIVPCPNGPPKAYPHLAAFVHGAPRKQIHSLWRHAATAVRENLGEAPLWLSTSGLGVAWLHLRLDSRPKYYQYAPYRACRWVP